MTPEDRAIIDTFRGHLARYRRLQQVPGSTWSDTTVAEWMERHRRDAADALYRRGFTRDQVAALLAEPSPQPRPARTLGEHMNRLIREGRT